MDPTFNICPHQQNIPVGELIPDIQRDITHKDIDPISHTSQLSAHSVSPYLFQFDPLSDRQWSFDNPWVTPDFVIYPQTNSG